ncbi:hypothetical protein [Gordonia effusa]|uniref:hypothetical protein n=1 Tax=Gordonia effusa TaxID=263908 RepID=UPI0003106BC8|nr:hypothetical protein [Gordonia effusa]
MISYPRVPIASRRFTDATPTLYIGQLSEDAPLVDVIAETIAGTAVLVFHAMLLRMSTVRDAGITALIDLANIAPKQRR